MFVRRHRHGRRVPPAQRRPTPRRRQLLRVVFVLHEHAHAHQRLFARLAALDRRLQQLVALGDGEFVKRERVTVIRGARQVHREEI